MKYKKLIIVEITVILAVLVSVAEVCAVQNSSQLIPINLSVTNPGQWQIPDTTQANVTYDNSFGYAGYGSLHVNSTYNTPGSWYSLSSLLINVSPDHLYGFETHVAYYNTNQSALIVQAYVNKSYSYQFFQLPGELTGNSSEFVTYSTLFKIPDNVHYLQIILAVGWLYKDGSFLSLYFSDFKLYQIE